jgi:hypothetical protein
MLPRSHAHFLSPERKSRRQNEGPPKAVDRPDRRGRFRRLAVARETSNVCVHPEKERGTDEISLSDIEGLSAEIENLGNLGREHLDHAWRDLFESDRLRRFCGDAIARCSAATQTRPEYYA